MLRKAETTERMCGVCQQRPSTRGEVWGHPMCSPCMCAWEAEVKASTEAEFAACLKENYARTDAWVASKRARRAS